MNDLNFIGIGSAFNVNLGNTAAFLNYGGSKILFDCGELIFARLKNSEFWYENNPIHVFVTHNHPDHIGSLGSFIFYSYYVKKAPVTVYGNAELKKVLNMMGVRDEFFKYVDFESNRKNFEFKPQGFSKDGFVIAPIATKHSVSMNCFGFLIKDTDSGSCSYFSGDASSIPEVVLQKFNEGLVNKLYLDVSWLDYPDNVHLSYKKLCSTIDKNRNKVYLMHLDENFNVPKAKADGFNVVGQ